MSEDIDLKIRAVAGDDASPVLRSLMRTMRQMEKLGAKLSASPINLGGFNSTAQKALAAQKAMVTSQRNAARSAGRAEKVADAGLRKRIIFVDRMQAQKVREEKQRDILSMRQLRQRLAFADRMSRQKSREERASAAEARRQDAASRRDERMHRAHLARLDRQSSNRRRDAGRSAGRVRDGLSDAAGKAGTAGLAVGAGTVVAGRRILGAEMSTDVAEKNLQSYAGLSADDARKLRTDWAAKLSVDLGSTVSAMLTGYIEAVKLGIPAGGAKQFAELSAKASEAWDIPLEAVQDALGGINTIMTSAGEKFDPKRLAGITNEVQVLAAGMSTTPQKLLEFFKQGAGAASVLGMSQEAALAFGAASTSLGNKAGESGTLLDYIAGRTIAMPGIAKRKGVEGKDVREMVGALGYTSADDMDRRRRADPDAFLFDFIERFGKIKDTKKRDKAIRTFAGQEWFGEFGRLTTGTATMRQARELQKQSKSTDAIGKNWAIHTQKLEFVAKQAKAALDVLAGEMGMVLAPLAKDGFAFLRDWAIKSAKALRVNFWAATRGLVEGFLGRPGQFKDLLSQWFGAGRLTANPKAFYDFFKGLAEGLREVWNTIQTIMVGVGKMLGIDTSTPEGMGRLTGLVVGGGIAAKLAPADLLGGLANGAGGIAGTILNLLGIGGGAAAGAAVGGAAAGAVSRAIPQVAIVGAVGVEILNWATNPDRYDAQTLKRFGDAGGGIKGANEMGVFGTLGLSLRTFRDMARKAMGLEPEKTSSTSSPAGALRQEMKDLGRTVDSSAQVQKAALERAGLYDSLRVPASFGGGGGGGGSLPASGPGRWSALASGGQYSEMVDAPRGSAARQWIERYQQFRSDKIVPADPTSDSRKRYASLSPSSDIGGFTGKTALDAIARAEGTAGRGDYEATLGYGRYATPSKPITTMSLEEAFAFGRQIKSKHGSSSAIGRYQIVGNTMKDAAKALGMDWRTTKFDAATQDAMAEWIAKKQGFGAWEGFKSHPGELAKAKAGSFKASPIASAPSAAGIASRVPTTAESVTNGIPVRPAGGAAAGGGGGSTVNLHAPITINGANQSPEKIAAAVERHLSERRMSWAHEIDYS